MARIRVLGVRGRAPLVVGEGAVWVAFSGLLWPNVYKIDSVTNRLTGSIRIPEGFFGAPRLSVGEGAVWAVTWGHQVFRIDPRTNDLASVIRLDRRVSDVFVGGGYVWVLHPGEFWGRRGALSRIDPRTSEIVPTMTLDTSLDDFSSSAFRGRRIAMGAGAIWVIQEGIRHGGGFPRLLVSEVVRLDPQSNQIVSTIDVGAVDDGTALLLDIDAEGDTVVVLSPYSVIEIDPATNTARRVISVRSEDPYTYPRHLALGADAVWLTMPGHGFFRIPLGR